MIYLKIAVCRGQDRGTAEFMFRDATEEGATRLALLLVRNDGWRARDVLDAMVAESRDDFVREGQLQAMFDEAGRDGLAYTINAYSPTATVSP